MSENEIKALLNVEEEFFDLDKEKKLSRQPCQTFRIHCLSKEKPKE